MQTFDREIGASIFGQNAEGYRTWRPSYPQKVFEVLSEEGVDAGQRCLEIGAGSGLATRVLADMGLRVTAIEPDRALAAGLPDVELLPLRFEDIPALEPFDFACAATSFHWLDQAAALLKVKTLLKPDGLWAMWWNVFGDPREPDDFMKASSPLFAKLAQGPSQGTHLPFALRTSERFRQIESAGFHDMKYHEVHWTADMTVEEVVGLTATFSPVARLDPIERNAFLSQIRAFCTNMGPVIRRRFVTPIYTARA